MRRLVAALLLLVPVTTLTVHGHATAGDVGGRIELSDPLPGLDTRVSPGTRVTEIALGAGVRHVSVLDAQADGVATVRPCGASPSADDAKIPFQAGEAVPPLRFVRSEEMCLAATTPVHVVTRGSGGVSPAPTGTGSAYVELLDGPVLFDDVVDPPPFATTTIALGRPPQLPADATGAVVNLSAFGLESGYAAIHRCTGPAGSADATYGVGTASVIVALPMFLAPSDTLCLTVFGDAYVSIDLLGWLTKNGPDPTALPPMWSTVEAEVPEPGLEAIVPERILDTRNATGWPDTSKVVAEEVVELSFGDLITFDTTAVSLNVTVTGTEVPGFLTVWPCDRPMPNTSNLNFGVGTTRANQVVATLSADGTVCVWANSDTHLLADVTGTYEFAGGQPARPITPERILDTRNATGVSAALINPAGSTVQLQVTGRGGVPATGVTAATFNVTAVQPLTPGFVTVWPCDAPRPETSNLNHGTGGAVPNLVTVKLAANGTVCLYSSAATHLLADVGAWYGPGATAGLVELTPDRLLDTRDGTGAPKGELAAGGTITLQVTGRGGVRADATAVVLNVTATGTAAAGFATVWPCDAARPTVSNLNFAAADTVPNSVAVRLSPDGTVCLFSDARTHLIADVAGFYTDAPTMAFVDVLG